MRKLCLNFFFILLSLAITITPGLGYGKEPVKIRVGYLPATHDILFFIAQDKGYFKEEGLDVEAYAFRNSGEVLEAMKAGKLDMGIPGIAAPIAFIAKGAPFKMVGGAAWFSAGIVAKPERAHEFKSLKDFKGKTIATTRLATGDATWRWGLVQAGLDLKKDVVIKEFASPGDASAAVQAGHVDAAVLWQPHETIAEQRGLKIVKWVKEIYPHPCCRQVAHEDYIARHPEGVVAYLKGIIRAEAFFRDPKNKEEVVKIGQKWLRLDESVIRKAFVEIDPLLGEPRTSVGARLGVVEASKYVDMMLEIGYIDKEGAVRAKAALVPDYLIKAYKELGLAKTDAEAKRLAGAL
ncbi:MAG: ABC transporter substrate-binding protein [candidate division NC10 bacterium]|nr:ABC transporter substrate-binding protein [candidate division NC10 bacterium]